MLSATAITSKDPIMLALGFPDVNSPKIIPILVTVDDMAPKLNLLGSLGNFTKQTSHHSFELTRQVCIIINVIFNFHLEHDTKIVDEETKPKGFFPEILAEAKATLQDGDIIPHNLATLPTD